MTEQLETMTRTLEEQGLRGVVDQGPRYLRVEVGRPEEGRENDRFPVFQFGSTATAIVKLRENLAGGAAGAAEVVAEVSMAAIGAHSPTTARQRAGAYLAAAHIAELTEAMVKAGIPLEQVFDMLLENPAIS